MSIVNHLVNTHSIINGVFNGYLWVLIAFIIIFY